MASQIMYRILFLAAPIALFASAKPAFQFDFGPAKVAPGRIVVTETSVYTKEIGYGFDLGSKVRCAGRGGDKTLQGHFCTSDNPFFFSVAVPEGNYTVTATFGDLKGASTATVKAESRRLMVEEVTTAAGQSATRTFTVNVRTPGIGSGGEVKLKARELGVLHWDDKLTLEFSNARPCIASLEITRTDKAVTVYLVGDSTVTDQPSEPWNSWGQMLPRFFQAGVAVANHAESGESLRSSLSSRRLDKVVSTIKPGDYLFIQFGHNDQKERGEGIGAFTTYKVDLKRYVSAARDHGAIPVLVTPVNRRTFDESGKIVNSLGDYPEAVRQVATENDVPLIDLNAMSKLFYEALGPEKSKRAFVDNTHHNNYGSYELAKCIVEGIKANKLELAKYLVTDVPPFDPSNPDPLDSFRIPASPVSTSQKPLGN